MISYVGIHDNLKTSPWPECASTTTKIENIMVNTHGEKCNYEKF